MIWRWVFGRQPKNLHPIMEVQNPPPQAPLTKPRLPTVRFDNSLVTDEIKSDLRANLRNISEFRTLPTEAFEPLYAAVETSVSRGRDMAMAATYILGVGLAGMTKSRAGEIAASLHNKASALITREKQLRAGIEYAVWLHSGAPCLLDPQESSRADPRLAAAHKAADGKRYRVAEGLAIGGRRTWPQRDGGCKCASRAIVPGLE